MFSVLSILGGAAAFEVRKRVAVTKERQELAQLREDRSELDSLLKGLKDQLSQALDDNESSQKAFEEVQKAAVLLGVQCKSLIKQTSRMEEEQAALKEENSSLREQNEELTIQVAEANQRKAEDVDLLQNELEQLRDQVRDAVDEFMDGILTRENLHARLNCLGVEVKYIEPEGQSSKELSDADDKWILQLRSALEPQTARMLTFGAAAGISYNQPTPKSTANTIVCQAPQMPSSSLTPAEKQLQIQQDKINAASTLRLTTHAAQQPAQAARKTIATADKENSRHTVNVRAKQVPAKGTVGSGVAFQLSNDSRVNNGRGLSLQRPSGGTNALKWHQNNTYVPEPLPMSQLATSVPRMDGDGPASFTRDITRRA